MSDEWLRHDSLLIAQHSLLYSDARYRGNLSTPVDPTRLVRDHVDRDDAVDRLDDPGGPPPPPEGGPADFPQDRDGQARGGRAAAQGGGRAGPSGPARGLERARRARRDPREGADRAGPGPRPGERPEGPRAGVEARPAP